LSSAGSSGSQFFSFLATKDHFSSNWTSRVRGGKSHEFVVESLGVGAGQETIADDGVLVDADEASGLADADAFGDMGQDSGGLGGVEAGVEQRGAFTLGEAVFAGVTVEKAGLVATVASADGEVAGVA
jgi:hypothetical protein